MYTRNPNKSVTAGPRSFSAVYPATMNFYKPTTVDEFTQVVDETDGSVCLTSAVTMLLNQNRLDKMSNAAILDAIAQSAQTSDALASIRSKCTDEQLISLVKSRYIQAPSELLAWSSHIESLFPDTSVNVEPAAPAPDSSPAPSE